MKEWALGIDFYQLFSNRGALHERAPLRTFIGLLYQQETGRVVPWFAVVFDASFMSALGGLF